MLHSRRYHRHRMWLTVMQILYYRLLLLVTDNCGVTLNSNRTCRNRKCSVRRRLYIYLDIYRLRRKLQDYVHTVTIEYAPFPAIPPTSDVVDCYANIVLPAPPVITDNCGVTLTPTGPVETGSVVCEVIIHIHGHIRTARQ
jgi:hypothetical protein